jgi:hypothetical protein
MTDRAAVVSALAAYANKPATVRDLRAEAGDTFGQPPFTALMQFTQTLGSRADLNALVAEVAPLIRAADPFRGGSIAINCGTLVEMGADPELVFPHLRAELPRHLALARRAHERKGTAPSALFAEDPDAARASAALMYLLLATMTVACRKAEFRIALRADPNVTAGIEALRESSREADFVAQVLNLTDGLELLVLVPLERKGFRVAIEAVATNAHLFSLLQAALIAGGHLAGDPLDEEVVAAATGASPPMQQLSDHARFHFQNWYGLKEDDTLVAMNVVAWLPVEARPVDTPRLDGVPIVLVGPKVFGLRGWDSDFFANFHDALRSRAEVVEVLAPDRVTDWLARIKRARR